MERLLSTTDNIHLLRTYSQDAALPQKAGERREDAAAAAGRAHGRNGGGKGGGNAGGRLGVFGGKVQDRDFEMAAAGEGRCARFGEYHSNPFSVLFFYVSEEEKNN